MTAAAGVLALAGCSLTDPPDSVTAPTSVPTPDRATSAASPPAKGAVTPPSTGAPSSPATGTPSPVPPVPTARDGDAEVDRARLRDTVDALAGRIGPREASGQAFRRAARLVETRLTDLGYEVRRQRVPVPAGVSWGVPVPAGTSVNVVAVAPGTDLDEPHLVVGAHLDTVPQAPGAADNASGVSVVLEMARLATLRPPPQPVVFVAFGAEEPRGPGDDLHHFGSQAYVASLDADQREALIGAIAIDTVGTSRTGVPVCTARADTDDFTRGVRQAVRRAGLPVRACANRTSDHWSFVRNGLDGTRVGLAGHDEYPEYHSAGDEPQVVRDRSLAKAAEAVWAALSREW